MRLRLVLFVLSAALSITACAGTKMLLQGANTATQIPQARADLIEYLPADRLAVIQGDVDLIDQTVAKFDKLIEGDAQITLRDAIISAFGSLDKARQLERAHLAIKSETIRHHTASKKPIPESLVSFNENLERDYKAGKELITSNSGLMSLAEYLELIGPIAIRIAVKAATGGLVDAGGPVLLAPS